MEEEPRRHGAPRSQLQACPEGADVISSLPDDLLLVVLARLSCLPTAAQTSLLSRRWRGLWTELPRVVAAFNDVPLSDLEAALACAACLGSPLLLDVCVPAGQDRVDRAQVSSLLHAASRLSPVELVFALPRNLNNPYAAVDLPLFHRATSIELDMRYLRLALPPSGGFPSLERLSLSGCLIDLSAMILRCPRLRVLRVNTGMLGAGDFAVHSPSLQELVVQSKNKWTRVTRRIDIEAPMLQQLTLSFLTGKGLSVSILAPKVDKISWRCSYITMAIGLGPWGLQSLILETAESHGHAVQLRVLSLHMRASVLNFEREIEKHLVADFSVVELHLTPAGHVVGVVALRLLGMNFLRSEVKQACPATCPCREFNNRRNPSILLTSLQIVEIIGFRGEDDEFDFLKRVFICAPMLKRMMLKLSDEVAPSNDGFEKLYNIFKKNPSVDSHVCFCSD